MTPQQWFICIRLCQTHLTCLHAFSPHASHPGSLPEQLRSDLDPVPENRARGAFPHPTYSMWLLLPGGRHFLAHGAHDLAAAHSIRLPNIPVDCCTPEYNCALLRQCLQSALYSGTSVPRQYGIGNARAHALTFQNGSSLFLRNSVVGTTQFRVVTWAVPIVTG